MQHSGHLQTLYAGLGDISAVDPVMGKSSLTHYSSCHTIQTISDRLCFISRIAIPGRRY